MMSRIFPVRALVGTDDIGPGLGTSTAFGGEPLGLGGGVYGFIFTLISCACLPTWAQVRIIIQFLVVRLGIVSHWSCRNKGNAFGLRSRRRDSGDLPAPAAALEGVGQNRESSDGRNFARGHKDAENSGAGVGRNKLEEF